MKAQPELPAVPWKVEVDPVSAEYAFTSPPKVAIAYPRTINDFLVPSTHSPFIAIGDNDSTSDRRIVFDLRTNRDVGRYIGKILQDKEYPVLHAEALSTDGELLAKLCYSSGTPRSFRLHIVSMKTGKPVWQLDLPAADNKTDYQRIDFTASNRLIVYENHFDRLTKPLTMSGYDLGSGRQTWQATACERTDAACACLSPGGRYVAIPNFKDGVAVQMYSTADGAHVGTLRTEIQSTGMASSSTFSPDGKHFASILDANLYVWDMAAGKLISQCKVANATANSLEWLADGKFMLLGGTRVIDVRNGNVVHTLESRKPEVQRRIINGDMLLSCNEADLRQPMNTLASTALPLTQFTELAELLASGGSRNETGLPPTKQAVRDGMVEYKNSGGAFKPIKLDPAPKGADAWLAKPITLAFPQPGSVRITTALNGGWAIVGQSTSRTQNGTAYLIDLTGAKPPQALKPPEQSKQVAISPDGKHGIFFTPEARLDLYELQPFRHVVGWRMDKQELPQQGVGEAVMLDAEHVLIPTRDKVIMWKLPECRAVYAIPSRHVIVSPSGEYLLQTSVGLSLVNARTGEHVTTLSSIGNTQDAAFSPDGGKLAAIMYDQAETQLVVWDLTTGAIVQRGSPAMTSFRGELHWLGDDRILIGSDMVDLKSGLPLWSYEGPLLQTPAYATSVWVGESAADGKYTLARVQLPDPAAANAIAAAKLSPPKPIFGPGSKVRFDFINVPQPDQARQLYTEAFTKNGIAVADSSEVTFRVERTRTTGEATTYQGGGKAETAASVQIIDRFSLIDASGKVLWTTLTMSQSTAGAIVELTNGESVQDHINARLPKTIGYVKVPAVLFPPASSCILGKSQLTPTGVVPK